MSYEPKKLEWEEWTAPSVFGYYELEGGVAYGVDAILLDNGNPLEEIQNWERPVSVAEAKKACQQDYDRRYAEGGVPCAEARGVCEWVRLDDDGGGDPTWNSIHGDSDWPPWADHPTLCPDCGGRVTVKENQTKTN